MERTLYVTSLRESFATFATYHPSFDELFDRFWSNFSLLSRPKAEHIESLTVEIPLSAREAVNGGQARVLIPARAPCPVCEGHGAVGAYECWECQGQGAITADYPVDIWHPPGIANEHAVQVPLSGFGIENFYLTVRFRVSEFAADQERQIKTARCYYLPVFCSNWPNR